MFTGIVQAKGRVRALKTNPFGVRLVLDRQGWRPPGYKLTLGCSISINGVCLTLAGLNAKTVEFDVIAQTLKLTNLGGLRPGSEVNIEPSVTGNSAMGGHIVQGHVDGVGTVAAVKKSAQEWRVTVTPPAELMEYMIPQGSVSIDGVSLTLAGVSKKQIEVALIPTTLEITTMGGYRRGGRVNLECDIVSKTIVHWLRNQQARPTPPGTPGSGGGVTLATLRTAGFAS
jgi:riboflavin synthase alpha subunit